MSFWEDVKFFKPSEFDCRSLPGSGVRMDEEFVILLDNLRQRIGRLIVISSGFRTRDHNLSVGGSPNSAHLRGMAADIVCTDSAHRAQIILAWLAMDPPVKRIGIDKTIVHLDIDRSLPNRVVWLY